MTSRYEINGGTKFCRLCTSRMQALPEYPEARLIGIGAAVTRRPLPHHRTYGSVYGGSRWLRQHFLEQ